MFMPKARSVPFHVQLPPSLAHDFHVVCAQQETTMAAVVRDSITKYVHKHKRVSSAVE